MKKKYKCFAIKCECLGPDEEGFLVSEGWSLLSRKVYQAPLLFAIESEAERALKKYEKRKDLADTKLVVVLVSVTVKF
jgi:hypothetical protein